VGRSPAGWRRTRRCRCFKRVHKRQDAETVNSCNSCYRVGRHLQDKAETSPLLQELAAASECAVCLLPELLQGGASPAGWRRTRRRRRRPRRAPPRAAPPRCPTAAPPAPRCSASCFRDPQTLAHGSPMGHTCEAGPHCDPLPRLTARKCHAQHQLADIEKLNAVSGLQCRDSIRRQRMWCVQPCCGVGWRNDESTPHLL
jgi:hypothetical protein